MMGKRNLNFIVLIVDVVGQLHRHHHRRHHRHHQLPAAPLGNSYKTTPVTTAYKTRTRILLEHMVVLHVIFTLLHKLEATIKMTVYVTLGIQENQGMLAFNAFLVNIGKCRGNVGCIAFFTHTMCLQQTFQDS